MGSFAGHSPEGTVHLDERGGGLAARVVGGVEAALDRGRQQAEHDGGEGDEQIDRSCTSSKRSRDRCRSGRRILMKYPPAAAAHRRTRGARWRRRRAWVFRRVLMSHEQLSDRPAPGALSRAQRRVDKPGSIVETKAHAAGDRGVFELRAMAVAGALIMTALAGGGGGGGTGASRRSSASGGSRLCAARSLSTRRRPPSR